MLWVVGLSDQSFASVLDLTSDTVELRLRRNDHHGREVRFYRVANSLCPVFLYNLTYRQLSFRY